METKTSTQNRFRRLLDFLGGALPFVVSPIFPGINPAVTAHLLDDAAAKRRTKVEQNPRGG